VGPSSRIATSTTHHLLPTYLECGRARSAGQGPRYRTVTATRCCSIPPVSNLEVSAPPRGPR